MWSSHDVCDVHMRSHHATSMSITLAESSMVDSLQAGRSGLQMSSWLGTMVPRWRTASSTRVGVLKVSAFCFVSLTVCSPYPTHYLRRPSFSSRRFTDAEQSSASYHICYITCYLLLSLEDILLCTLVTRNYCCHAHEVTLSFMDTLIALTYLLTSLTDKTE